MLNLIEAMDEINNRRSEVSKEYEMKLKAFDEAYKVLADMNEACIVCKGKGKILRIRACAEDDRPDPDNPRDWNTCSMCHGTGRVQHKER